MQRPEKKFSEGSSFTRLPTHKLGPCIRDALLKGFSHSTIVSMYFRLTLQVVFDSDDAERMHDSFTVLSRQRLQQNGDRHPLLQPDHLAAYYALTPPSTPPTAPRRFENGGNGNCCPSPSAVRRPASPLRMSQLSSPVRLPPNLRKNSAAAAPAQHNGVAMRPPHYMAYSASANSSPMMQRRTSPSAIPARILQDATIAVLGGGGGRDGRHQSNGGSHGDLTRLHGRAAGTIDLLA